MTISGLNQASIGDITTLWDVAVKASPPESEEMAYAEGFGVGSPMHGAMLLRSLDRLRRELERTPADAQMCDPIVIKAGDAVLLARAILKRLA